MAKKPIGKFADDLRPLLRPIGELSADPANARTHDERSIEAIAASYRRFGQQKPIVVDADGVCIAGSGQLAAARKLGWTHLAAVSSNLAGPDRAGFAIADNRTTDLSRFDDSALAAQLQSIADADAELLQVAGYSTEELANLLSDAADEDKVTSVDIPESWQVVVECDSETQQREVFERLRGEGLPCRLLTL